MNDQDKKFYSDLMILLKKEFSELATNKEDIARIKTDNKCIMVILLILLALLYFVLLYTIF